jgi:NADH:ubiquinone oxidoreductase subunit E
MSTVEEAVDAAVAENGVEPSSLVGVLKHLRDHHHDLSDPVLRSVADRLGVPVGSVEAVATFYSFLQTGPTGQHTVRVCRTVSCMMAGADQLAATFVSRLGTQMGTTSEDGAVTLEWTACLGQCDHAPAALVDDKPVWDAQAVGTVLEGQST